MNPSHDNAMFNGLSLEDLNFDLNDLLRNSGGQLPFDLSQLTPNPAPGPPQAPARTAAPHPQAGKERPLSPPTTQLLEQLQAVLHKAQTTGNYPLLRQLQGMIQSQTGLPLTPLSTGLYPTIALPPCPTNGPPDTPGGFDSNFPAHLSTSGPPAMSPTLLPEAAIPMPRSAKTAPLVSTSSSARKRQRPEADATLETLRSPAQTGAAEYTMSPSKRPISFKTPMMTASTPADHRGTSTRSSGRASGGPRSRVHPGTSSQASSLHNTPRFVPGLDTHPSYLQSSPLVRPGDLGSALLHSPFLFDPGQWSPWQQNEAQAQALANLTLTSPGLLCSPAMLMSDNVSPAFQPMPGVQAMDFSLGSPSLSATPAQNPTDIGSLLFNQSASTPPAPFPSAMGPPSVDSAPSRNPQHGARGSGNSRQTADASTLPAPLPEPAQIPPLPLPSTAKFIAGKTVDATATASITPATPASLMQIQLPHSDSPSTPESSLSPPAAEPSSPLSATTRPGQAAAGRECPAPPNQTAGNSPWPTEKKSRRIRVASRSTVAKARCQPTTTSTSANLLALAPIRDQTASKSAATVPPSFVVSSASVGGLPPASPAALRPDPSPALSAQGSGGNGGRTAPVPLTPRGLGPSPAKTGANRGPRIPISPLPKPVHGPNGTGGGSAFPGLSANQIAQRLAERSNYQNMMSGDSQLLGLTYNRHLHLGLEQRRSSHKAAEQKRRDSLKMCFDNLKSRVPHLDEKLISKVYILNKAADYIVALEAQHQRDRGELRRLRVQLGLPEDDEEEEEARTMGLSPEGSSGAAADVGSASDGEDDDDDG
ncbi:hypothetical protein IWQ60_010066 [Tieghemiomyces parasiticus]|uniref:BHLH domain-containing protein n=1 Tax=Tieghemiomyces parasiticus TaxID=78921 RepID=A0A9W7ZRN6_9FUNG|nr:hypothetical protein IWQ60_010066 [Tieghemiomyces parasiticus]